MPARGTIDKKLHARGDAAAAKVRVELRQAEAQVPRQPQHLNTTHAQTKKEAASEEAEAAEAAEA